MVMNWSTATLVIAESSQKAIRWMLSMTVLGEAEVSDQVAAAQSVARGNFAQLFARLPGTLL